MSRVVLSESEELPLTGQESLHGGCEATDSKTEGVVLLRKSQGIGKVVSLAG
jgi:hypothetical protein